jgi:hypothetical protein
LRGEEYLAYLRVDIGMSWLKFSPFSAKCTECSFNPNVNEEVAKYPDAELARRGVLGLPLS